MRSFRLGCVYCLSRLRKPCVTKGCPEHSLWLLCLCGWLWAAAVPPVPSSGCAMCCPVSLSPAFWVCQGVQGLLPSLRCSVLSTGKSSALGLVTAWGRQGAAGPLERSSGAQGGLTVPWHHSRARAGHLSARKDGEKQKCKIPCASVRLCRRDSGENRTDSADLKNKLKFKSQ